MRSWSRLFALSFALMWALVPQLACFLPESSLTAAEMDCCQGMGAECGHMQMPDHGCCQKVVRTETAPLLKAAHHAVPQPEAAAATYDGFDVRHSIAGNHNFLDVTHAPPPLESSTSLILRI